MSSNFLYPTRAIILFAIFLFIAGTASANTLQNAAASMSPGDWREVSTNNMVETLGSKTGSSGHDLTYVTDMSWHSGSKRVYFIGSDHADTSQFSVYDEQTNTWIREPRGSWMPSVTGYLFGMSHGYDHSTIDISRGFYYHRNFFGENIYRYTIATKTWSQVPSLASKTGSGNNSCCDGIEYFPELDSVIWVGGDEIWGFSEATQQWTLIAGGLSLTSTWNYTEYNPVHKIVVFGNPSNSTYGLINSSGQVSSLSTPPTTPYNGSGFNGILTVDPVSGDYLFLAPDTRDFYTFNPITDSWTQQPSKPPFENHGVVATPIADYGVTFFAACRYSTICKAYLYKHADGSGSTTPSAPQSLRQKN